MGYHGLGIIPILLIIAVPVVLLLLFWWCALAVLVIVAIINKKTQSPWIKISASYVLLPFIILIYFVIQYSTERMCYLFPVKDYKQVYINGGTFIMGDARYVDESPAHNVTVSSFYIDESEVTTKEYFRVMGTEKKWYAVRPRTPIDNVNWVDALLYCNERSKEERRDTMFVYQRDKKSGHISHYSVSLTGNGYRLPTEAEWEYACRAGTTTDFPWGNDTSMAHQYMTSRSIGDPSEYTHVVKSRKPNQWGLYDMNDNTREWTLDCTDIYPSSAVLNPSSGTVGDSPFDVERSIRNDNNGRWFGKNWGRTRCSARRSWPSENGISFRVVRRASVKEITR